MISAIWPHQGRELSNVDFGEMWASVLEAPRPRPVSMEQFALGAEVGYIALTIGQFTSGQLKTEMFLRSRHNFLL